MNLAAMRLEVRRGLNEATADLFADSEINDWLNEAAKVMCELAQPMQAFWQKTLTASQQEYELPGDFDEIFSVKLTNSSNIEDLSPIEAGDAQFGAFGTGTPSRYYLRYLTTQRADQTASGIILTNIASTQTVIGFYPAPSSALTVTVYYHPSHYKMQTDASVPWVPVQFRRGLVSYAIARGKEKERAYQEADRFQGQFVQFAEKLRDKMITRGQGAFFPKVRSAGDDDYRADVVVRIPRSISG